MGWAYSSKRRDEDVQNFIGELLENADFEYREGDYEDDIYVS
jgi:hypothetical protein